MKLASNETDMVSLSRLGKNIAQLIVEKNYDEIAKQYGFALSFGRSPAVAIADAVADCLSYAGPVADLSPALLDVEVVYFEKNDARLLALVTASLGISNNDGCILVEIVVSESDESFHACLEQISFQSA